MSSNSPTRGQPLGWLVAGFYVLFTLMPNSNTMMVTWPWVLFWQVGLVTPILWWVALPKSYWLGRGLDWLVGLFLVVLGVSTLTAPFPGPARWYAWAALGYVVALYALHDWLRAGDLHHRRQLLLRGQGGLVVAFIGLSLGLWSVETLLPGLQQLQAFHRHGVDGSFDFSSLYSRNWAPIGHQNYVAGYLVLVLPLLLSLTLTRRGPERWGWAGGLGLGLVDLFTTSSQGGWAGLGVALLGGLIVLGGRRVWSRRQGLLLGGLVLAGLGGVILLNDRFRLQIERLASGHGLAGLSYRLVTGVTGWAMGSDRPWTGVGLGGVPLWFQHYRPFWAGQAAEWTYQLHSTPAQIWAELGLGGLALLVLGAGWLAYQLLWLARQPLPAPETCHLWALGVGLMGYLVAGLTDFQLDNIPITGTIIIYGAWLISWAEAQPGGRTLRGWTGVCLGLLLVATVWLVPVHRAWQSSSLGFTALEEIPQVRQPAHQQRLLGGFISHLTLSARLAPWEPYYPWQLGATLGHLGVLGAPDLIPQGIAWFQRGIQVSPYLEFGYSNLGWLLLKSDPPAATRAFGQACRLLPGKQGVFLGLGFSLLAQGKVDLAAQAFALEALRDPPQVTSPLWRSPELLAVYQQFLGKMRAWYTQQLQLPHLADAYQVQLHHWRGALAWWQGDLTAAQADWQGWQDDPAPAVINTLAQGGTLPVSQGTAALVGSAWLHLDRRAAYLEQAWIQVRHEFPPPEILGRLVVSMQKADTFDQWLHQAPSQQYFRVRDGFSIVSRHMDGPPPVDLLPVLDNLAMTLLNPDLFPSPQYLPALDQGLQPWRQTLLDQVAGLAN